MNYEVGQILYVIYPKNECIMPLLVCEEIRRRTIEGEEVSYLVRSGSELTTCDLKTITGTIYTNIQDALAELKNNFELFLQKQASWTSEMERVWYHSQQTKSQVATNTKFVEQSKVSNLHVTQSNLDVPSYEELAEQVTNRTTK